MGRARERTLGAFVIERELGEGGMGEVLLARHRTLDRPVVLKKLRRELAASPEGVERFEREARAAAQIHHSNVVTVYDCFCFRSDHYIAQEYVAGLDLHAALGRVGSLPSRVAALIALEIARALEEIHAHGTVHRDLKPANILLGVRGEVKVADFGIALRPTAQGLTRPGMMIGSPPYMSPEQMLGERVDPRSDLFALGVVGYEMLTGSPPYAPPSEIAGETLLARMQRERYMPLRRAAPRSPRALRRVLRSCLRARPRQRPRDAAWVCEHLERLLGHPSPAAARDEIASWLRNRAVFAGLSVETRVAPRPERRAAGRGRWGRRALAACATSAALATFVVVTERVPWAPYAYRGGAAEAEMRPAPGGGRSARLRIGTEPATRCRIDDGPWRPVVSGDPLQLRPGTHRLRCEHPELGASDQEIELRPDTDHRLTPRFAPVGGERSATATDGARP
ncbi:MAG: serine/threonine-protein kinase [Myxococcota bacterium]